jgi:hypothetical protein
VELSAISEATIDRLATANNAPGIHQFQNGTSSETFQESGTAWESATSSCAPSSV